MKLSEITPGTVLRRLGSGEGYVVTANYGSRITAVRTVDVTNPPEWAVVHHVTGALIPIDPDKPTCPECGGRGYIDQGEGLVATSCEACRGAGLP